MNEKEQAIFEIIMKHMRINGSEDCSTSEFESDVEDAAKEIAAQQSVHLTASGAGGRGQNSLQSSFIADDQSAKHGDR